MIGKAQLSTYTCSDLSSMFYTQYNRFSPKKNKTHKNLKTTHCHTTEFYGV